MPLRGGSLWDKDGEEWTETLEKYQMCVQALSATKKYKSGDQSLSELDHWWTTVLPQAIRARNPAPYLTLDELSNVMAWKLRKGKFRPLMRLIRQNTESQVQSCSQAAFLKLLPASGTKHKPEVAEAVKELSKLRGVGPATASAVLAAYCPEECPFMSDEALEAVNGKREYTLSAYISLRDGLCEKATNLGPSWTAEKVGKAMW
eukprot:CAMPEP_0113936432 /NCGR_PEP_ID=MMETSP1339-20121228/3347_1 /TAXON_ID=94617 /ORGANISM="Fibrocapsa japonica" /LENGTH=203 /DNA_ID=CAMNT_0000938905 /DNA_START=25 /DNA_END=633 /DNA_ORIENTATION=+ /assembly_acc=CAM_ASM_000762